MHCWRFAYIDEKTAVITAAIIAKSLLLARFSAGFPAESYLSKQMRLFLLLYWAHGKHQEGRLHCLA